MGPGPAGIPQLEYLFSRLVCVSVPLGYTILLVILVIAGIKYLTSGGEPKAVQAAHHTVTWGLLGIVFLALAWLILQLIQNFTGVEVTKFTLASLPGVQGFTGSCWESPPVAPNPPPTQTRTKTKNLTNNQLTSNNNYLNDSTSNQLVCTQFIHSSTKIDVECKTGEQTINPWPISCKEIPGFDYPITQCLVQCPNSYFDSLGNDSFIGQVLTGTGASLETLVYSTNDIPGFEKIVDKPIVINIGHGAKNEAIYQLNRKNDQAVASVMTVQAKAREFSNPDIVQARIKFMETLALTAGKDGLLAGVYMSFEKNKTPTGLIEAMHHSQKIGEKLMSKGEMDLNFGYSKDMVSKTDFDSVALTGFDCPNSTYYSLLTFSPLLYFYPKSETIIKVAVNTPIISTIPTQDNTWHLKAFPNGSLVTDDNQPLSFIPYEFLRRDFRRPDKGVVLNSEHLVGYLKDSLWKSLGLTTQEIEDYWKDLEWRIPEANYYFISLIDRSEIDRVLPMEVNPKPDTVIRNMTYILPLDQPFIPTPVKLEAPTRAGFTVLENGGFIDGF